MSNDKLRSIMHLFPEINLSQPQQQQVQPQNVEQRMPPEPDPWAEYQRVQKQNDQMLVTRLKRAQLLKAVNDAEQAAGLAPSQHQGGQPPIADPNALLMTPDGQMQQPPPPNELEGLKIPETLLEQLPEMDEDKRNAVIGSLERIARLNAMSRDRGQLATLGLLGFMGERPQATAPDVQKYMETLLTAITTGMKLNDASSGNRQPQPGINDKILEKLIDKAFGNNEASKPQSGTLRETLKELKELGLLQQPQQIPGANDPTVAIRLAEIRRDTDIKLAELGLSKQQAEQHMELEESKQSMIKDGINTLLQAGGAAIGGGDLAGLMQTGQLPGPPSPAAAAHTTQNVVCAYCNTAFDVIDPVIGKQFPCPSCKKMLEFGPPIANAGNGGSNENQPPPGFPPPSIPPR